jgi:ribosomal protein S27E
VNITNKILANHEEAIQFVTGRSYGGNTAYLAAYTTKKLSKGYQDAFNTFFAKYSGYLDFEKNLTIAYGRKSTKATCPYCGSSINLKFGGRFKACPVCGSTKIISDSNWKTLETKQRMAERAAENLAKEAEKNDVMFVCGIEWHC